MKMAYNLEPEQDWCVQDKAMTFSGPPYRCVGTLHVRNLSDSKLKVRYLPAVSNDPALSCDQLFCQVQLQPNAEQTVQARLNMSRSTPPGKYQVNIEIGQKTVCAQVEVLEHDVLKIQPNRTVLEGGPGDILTKTINFHNQGNTEIFLPGRSMVWFEERNWAGHNFVQTIRSTKEGDDYEVYLNALLKRFQNTMLPAITVDFDRDHCSNSLKEIMLPPDDMLSRDITLTLPEGLQKGKTYHGFVKVQRFRFWLALYCNSGVSKAENTQLKSELPNT